MDRSNSELWSEPAVVAEYATDGPVDDGERVALEHVAPLLAHARLLDVGIGGGRTTGMLAPRVGSYHGVDISPAMLALARSRFPTLDLRIGDACALTEFADASMDFVLFSLNGLDCLDHKDRLRALDEFARLVAPGGRLLLSTFSLDGPSFGERPGRRRRRRPDLGVTQRARRTLKHLSRSPRALADERAAYAAAAVRADEGEGWATTPAAAHGFRFLIHFATLASVVGSLGDAGFEVEAVWDPSGAPVDPTCGQVSTDYFYVLARRVG